MAIKKSFNATTIRKPGAYSKFGVDTAGGTPLGSNDVIFLIGESSKGAPGSTSGVVEFSASRLDSLIDTFGEGPLVDCAVAASRPSITPGVGAPGRFLVYKTNASTQASGTVVNGDPANMFTVKDRAYGEGGNLYSIVVAAGTTGNQKNISITEVNGTTESLGENDANVILQVQYTGDASTATLAIAGASRSALVLSTTLAGDQTDGSTNQSITLSNYTLAQVAALLNAATGYTATLQTATEAANPGTDLDPVSATDIKTAAVDFYKLQIELLDLINESGRVEATEAGAVGGVPTNQTVTLTGGAQGASTNSNFSTGLSKSLSKKYNTLVPCISRDATDDIADADRGFTDAASTYTISSVLSAVGAHLTLRGNTKNRREAQAICGFRDSTKATCFTTVSGLADYNMQVAIQDALFVDANGNTVVGHPHVFAAMCAGIRLGTAVGEPLTHKYLRTSGVGHFINATTLLEAGDFDPVSDVDDAIDNGVLFAEEANGAYRIVVDNTSYGLDQSFVYNRGSVIEAAYYVNKTLRETAENVFVGKKVSNGLASSIKSAVRNKLRELNSPDVQVITSSDDAPEGFIEETFVVTISGNTARVQVHYKPVQGLDFVFFDFTLGDITQTA